MSSSPRAAIVALVALAWCGCGDAEAPKPAPQVLVAFERGQYAFDGKTDEPAVVANMSTSDARDVFVRVAIFEGEKRLAHGLTARGGPNALFLEVVVPAASIGPGPATALFETVDTDGRVRFTERRGLDPE